MMTRLAPVLAFILLGCCEASSPSPPAPPCRNIVELLQDIGTFETLIEAVTFVDGLADTLSTTELTLFAPTDEAFEIAGLCSSATEGPACADILTLNLGTLTEILLYHVTPGTVLAADVLGTTVDTLEGGSFQVSDSGVISDSTGGSSTIVTTDNIACNGVVHVVDALLVPPVGTGPDPTAAPINPPPTASPTAEATTAPTTPPTEAPTASEGGGPPVAVVTPTEPPAEEEEEEEEEEEPTEAPTVEPTQAESDDCEDIVTLLDAVNSNGDYDALMDAVASVDGLGAYLAGDELTLFAPDDEAFAAAGLCAAAKATETCTDITTLDMTVVQSVLLYHVTEGTLLAADVLGTTVITLSGGSFDVSADAVITDGSGATSSITGTDILACNGVVHTIDGVLLPSVSNAPTPEATAVPSDSAPTPTQDGTVYCSDQCTEAYPCYNDSTCADNGGIGCNAHGSGTQCRFCGRGSWVSCEALLANGGGDGPREDGGNVSPPGQTGECQPHSDVAKMLMEGFDKSVYADPEVCLGESAGLLCNYMGLGQQCRGCWLTCAGAAAGILAYPEFNNENIVLCPSSGITDYATQC